MPNLIELEITTIPDEEQDPIEEQDSTALATVEGDSYSAKVVIRDGRLVLELGPQHAEGPGWCIDCGPVGPGRSA